MEYFVRYFRECDDASTTEGVKANSTKEARETFEKKHKYEMYWIDIVDVFTV